MRTILIILLQVCWVGHAAVPTFQSFESNQFDTNALTIKYRSDWTNEVGVIHPSTVNTEVTLTNLNLYETFVTPAKVYALSLGTNELNVATNTSWLLSSPTNDASQVILSLSAGKFQGQWLLITSQNDTGGFTLPDGSEQYDVPGALVDTQGDWVGTTNRGSILQYVAPDWIEMFRFNPELPAPEGFTIGAGLTNIAGVLSATGGGGDTIWTNVSGTIQPLDGQTTNQLRFTSGAADNATNIAWRVNTLNFWDETASRLAILKNGDTNRLQIDPWGGISISPHTTTGDFNGNPNGNVTLQSVHVTSLGDSTANRMTVEVVDDLNYGRATSGSISLNHVSDTNLTAIISVSANAPGQSAFWGLDARTGTPAQAELTSFRLVSESGDLLRFSPKIVSTGSAVVNFVDTANQMTNGDALFQLLNKEINRFKVQHDGTLSIQNTTNRLGVVAGVLQLDGYNIGGSSSVITYTNQFVYNGKVTFNQPVYVTNSSTIYINGVDVRGDARLLACSDLTTAITVSTNKAYFYAPYALTVTRVKATLNIAQASGSTFTVDINEAGTSILSTELTVDNAENTSDDATAAPVISDAAIANNARVSIDVDQIGNGTAAGLIVEVYFTPQ